MPAAASLLHIPWGAFVPCQAPPAVHCGVRVGNYWPKTHTHKLHSLCADRLRGRDDVSVAYDGLAVRSYRAHQHADMAVAEGPRVAARAIRLHDLHGLGRGPLHGPVPPRRVTRPCKLYFKVAPLVPPTFLPHTYICVHFYFAVVPFPYFPVASRTTRYAFLHARRSTPALSYSGAGRLNTYDIDVCIKWV